MRKHLLTVALAGAIMIAPGLVPQARADHGWFAGGTGFRVGAAHLSFFFGQPFARYAPAYYYRYDRPISYRGYHCSDRCYRQGGYYYHHESCPVVRAHFRAYNVDPYAAYSRYAPRYDSYYSGYDGYYSGYGRDGYYADNYDNGYYDNGYYGDGYGRGYGGYSRIDVYYDNHRSHRNDRYYRDNRYRDDRYYRNDYRHDRSYRNDRRYDNRHDGRYRGQGRGHHKHGPGCGHRY